jgi:hypothetical protein
MHECQDEKPERTPRHLHHRSQLRAQAGRLRRGHPRPTPGDRSVGGVLWLNLQHDPPNRDGGASAQRAEDSVNATTRIGLPRLERNAGHHGLRVTSVHSFGKDSSRRVRQSVEFTRGGRGGSAFEERRAGATHRSAPSGGYCEKLEAPRRPLARGDGSHTARGLRTRNDAGRAHPLQRPGPS